MKTLPKAVFYTKSKNYEQQVAHASLYEVSPPLPMLSRGSLAAFDPSLGCDPHLRRSQRLLRVSCGSAGARSIILGPILSGRAADLSHSQPAWLSPGSGNQPGRLFVIETPIMENL